MSSQNIPIINNDTVNDEKTRPDFSKLKIQNTDEIISLFISIAAKTLTFKNIVLHEPYNDFIIRGTLNIFISAPPGQTKSTILNEIGQNHKVEVIDTVTRASMVGSIDGKTSQFIPPACWNCRNNFLLLDEFNASGSMDLVTVLLQIMEKNSFHKVFARSTEFHQKAGNGLSCDVKDGHIKVKTHVATIISGMYSMGEKMSLFKRALLTRTIPIRYNLSVSEMARNAATGNPLYKPIRGLVEFGKRKKPKEIHIYQEDYMKILNFVVGFFERNASLYKWVQHGGSVKRDYEVDVSGELFLRTVCDCCRVFCAFDGKHNNYLYGLVCALKATRGLWRPTMKDMLM